MSGKSCFFIGHADASTEVFPALAEAVERHISEYGATVFYVGNYGTFDRMAARAVINSREKHPEISLFLLLPYHPAERQVIFGQGFDGSFYPPGMEKVPRRFAIVRANRYMIDHADYLIAHAWHPASNARNLVDYARKREEKGMITVTLI